MMKLKVLCGRFLQPCDEVIPVLILLQASERHFSAGDVFFRVFEVLEQRLLVPGNALVDIGGGVRVTFHLTGFTAEEPVEIGPDFVGLASTDSVTLRATSLEKTCTL